METFIPTSSSIGNSRVKFKKTDLFFREINTEDGINFETFLEELRLVSMTNEQFRDAFCDSSRSNSANTFHDEGIFRFSINQLIVTCGIIF